MDDDEYYSKLRNHNLNRTGSSKPGEWKNPYAGLSKKVKEKTAASKSDFKEWAVTQGREDAEMLYERKHEDEDE